MKKLSLTALVAVFLCSGATAATITVTKTADTNDGVCDADCSLREAIAVANDSDTINFFPSRARSRSTAASWRSAKTLRSVARAR